MNAIDDIRRALGQRLLTWALAVFPMRDHIDARFKVAVSKALMDEVTERFKLEGHPDDDPDLVAGEEARAAAAAFLRGGGRACPECGTSDTGQIGAGSRTIRVCRDCGISWDQEAPE